MTNKLLDMQQVLIRRAINDSPRERAELEEEFGQVWDTQQLQEDFTVLTFSAPFVGVIRKSDNVEGALFFQHAPRYYWGFTEVGDE